VFHYTSIGQSTGATYDTVAGFTAGAGGDVFDVATAVAGVDAAITTGALSRGASFDANLAA